MIDKKKGIVFTIVALVISGFVLIMFYQLLEVPVDDSVELDTLKVRSINNFLNQVEDVVTAQAIASSKSIINSYIKEMYDSASFSYATNFDDNYVSCMENDTACPTGAIAFKPAVDYLSHQISQDLSIDNDIIIENVSIKHETPWDLNVSFYFNIVVQEDNGLFLWNISRNLSGIFSIVGFKDPIQAASGYPDRPSDLGEVIKITLNEDFKDLSGITSGVWFEKPSTLNNLSKDKYFFEYRRGISFLNRLKGNFVYSDMGIARVELPIYDGTGNVIRQGHSSLDWHFWSTADNNENIGRYNFDEIEDITTVLGIAWRPDYLASDYNLSNTLNNTIIPLHLANQANVSGSSYFINI